MSPIDSGNASFPTETTGKDRGRGRCQFPSHAHETEGETAMPGHDSVILRQLPNFLFAGVTLGARATIRWIREAPERSAQRRALAALDAAQLRDIGLSRTEADAEVARLLWRR